METKRQRHGRIRKGGLEALEKRGEFRRLGRTKKSV